MSRTGSLLAGALLLGGAACAGGTVVTGRGQGSRARFDPPTGDFVFYATC